MPPKLRHDYALLKSICDEASSQNRCIEVKSTWTAKLNNHTIFLKQDAAKKLGYIYEIWIYNTKGEIVEFHD